MFNRHPSIWGQSFVSPPIDAAWLKNNISFITARMTRRNATCFLNGGRRRRVVCLVAEHVGERVGGAEDRMDKLPKSTRKMRKLFWIF